MPKHLVTALGLIVSLGVVALGVALVALPLYLQSVGVATETATVENTNAIYEAQIATLSEEEENLDAINADVTSLRGQIPAVGQFDDVFEVVGRAAAASGMTLSTVTVGDQVVFAARTGNEDNESAAPAVEPSPAASEPSSDSAAPDAEPDTAPATGRTQVDFVIQGLASDMAQVTAFLDALRSGPRLLNSIESSTTQGTDGVIAVQVTALTYVDAGGQ